MRYVATSRFLNYSTTAALLCSPGTLYSRATRVFLPNRPCQGTVSVDESEMCLKKSSLFAAWINEDNNMPTDIAAVYFCQMIYYLHSLYATMYVNGAFYALIASLQLH